MAEKYKRKIVLLGDGAVGKTSLVKRYVEQKFSDEYIATIGANFKKKTIEYDDPGVILDLLIGDLIGQQGFQKTQKSNMKGASGALLVCDLTRPETRESIESYWISLLEDVLGQVPPVLFLANKSDLIESEGKEMQEYRSSLLNLSEKYESKFFFTSAKTGENVEQAFRDMGLLTLDQEPANYFNEDLYRVEENISPTKALDLIKAQLYVELGGEDFVNPILQNQLPKAGIDVRESPSLEELKELISEIKDVEEDFLGEEAKKYYLKRKNLLRKVSSD